MKENQFKKVYKYLTCFLWQPYPFYYRGKWLGVIAGLLFAVTLFFSYIFEPFNVYLPEHKMNYFWISFIHALNPVLIIGMLSFIKISTVAEENWNVIKEILLIISFLFLAGIAQFLVRDIIYDNPDNWTMRYFLEEVRNTILIGTLFAILFTSLNHNRLNSKNIRKASILHLPDGNSKLTNAEVFIETQVKSDNFTLNTDHFIYAKADGNYAEIYLSAKSNKMVKRITLKELEWILKPYPNIIKTHRSYLVNLNYINKITGNAQGYKLRLKNCEENIPVSRNMIQSFDTSLNAR